MFQRRGLPAWDLLTIRAPSGKHRSSHEAQNKSDRQNEDSNLLGGMLYDLALEGMPQNPQNTTPEQMQNLHSDKFALPGHPGVTNIKNALNTQFSARGFDNNFLF